MKIKFTISILICSSFLILYSFKTNKIEHELSSIKIGAQTWSSGNLDVVCFQNGDSLFHVKTYEEWEYACNNKIPAYSDIENNIESSNLPLGKLYNWYAIVDKRKLAPKGWKIPTENDWKKLIKHLGGEKIAGEKLKSINYWNNLNLDIWENIGFNAIPTGMRGFDAGFYGGRNNAYFWSPAKGNYPHCFITIEQNKNSAEFNIYHDLIGVSVRCIKKQ